MLPCTVCVTCSETIVSVLILEEGEVEMICQSGGKLFQGTSTMMRKNATNFLSSSAIVLKIGQVSEGSSSLQQSWQEAEETSQSRTTSFGAAEVSGIRRLFLQYFTRKQNYAVAATIVCNDHKRIRYISIRWPGSVHNQMVYQNSVIYRIPSLYFSDLEYLLGDSAYTPSSTMEPAYKK